MAELLAELSQLPSGSHCVSFHSSQSEAEDHAVEFLAGSPEGQASSYWVADPALQSSYQERLAERAPGQIGCVHVLDGEQVHPVDGRLRPVEEVVRFVSSHPEGVTGGAERISRHWGPANVPEHLEYEAWFDQQPRRSSRFLCPYDLRTVPPDRAPQILRELGSHHSHVVLSSSPEPAIQLLQLFIFGSPRELPPALDSILGWAVRRGLIEASDPSADFALTEAGNQIVQDWSRLTTVDW